MTSTASAYPSQEQVLAAAANVGYALSGKQHYAVVGGAACAILGSLRQTFDVVFVVPKGETKAARALLKEKPEAFQVDKRTNHTDFLSTPRVEIEILTPPALFKEDFSKSTPTIMVNGVCVLKPTLILNAKCRSILGRANEYKKQTDANDIEFLLSWCANNAVFPTATEVPNITKEFVNHYIATFGGADLWANIGYNVENGTWE